MKLCFNSKHSFIEIEMDADCQTYLFLAKVLPLIKISWKMIGSFIKYNKSDYVLSNPKQYNKEACCPQLSCVFD